MYSTEGTEGNEDEQRHVENRLHTVCRVGFCWGFFVYFWGFFAGGWELHGTYGLGFFLWTSSLRVVA